MTNPQCRIAFALEITLLEDLHTGSGMGSTVVDRLLARAPDGTPIVAREHLKGVWRDNAQRLEHLGRLSQTDIDRLFGTETGKRGGLIAPELRPDAHNRSESLFWDSTARKTGDRAPDDHSLRRTEYLPAGITLSGRGALAPDCSDLGHVLERIVRFTNALGSERTRGSGLITAKLTWRGLAETPHRGLFEPPSAPTPDVSAGLRLLLRAEAPLCIPTTGAPGNIIPSEHHIPGRTLFGALAAWIIEQGSKPDVLFERRLSIGPAYPLPRALKCADSQALAAVEVVPIPLNLWTSKPKVGEQRTWPHWAGKPVATGSPSPDANTTSASPDSRLRDSGARVDEPEPPVSEGLPGAHSGLYDMLANRDRKSDAAEQWRPDKTRYKRPRDDAYLARSGTSAWTYFEAPLGLRMRNRRGHPIKDVLETDTALFTLEQMPAGSRFVAEIRPLDQADAASVAALKTLLAGLFDPTAHAPPLRIGRGGAPVVIEGWCPLPSEPVNPVPDKPEGGLTLTLISDLIARTPDLGFHTELSVAAIKDCLAPALAKAVICDENTAARAYSDSVRYQGFNATAGLPTAPRVAIRRGSVLHVKGACAAALAAALQGQDAIGTQTWEGNGRFVFDLSPDPGGIQREPDLTAHMLNPVNQKRASCDRIIAAANAFCATRETLEWLPGRSQLGNLRNWLANAPANLTRDGLREQLNRYRAEVQARRGKQAWVRVFDEVKLNEVLETACCEDDDCLTENVELFLRVMTLRKVEHEAAKAAPQKDEPEDQTSHQEDQQP